MPTIEELGRKAKKKFEKYRHLDDTAAGFAFKIDWPGAYEHYEGHEMAPAPLVVREKTAPARQNSSLESSVQDLISDLNEYNVDPKLEQNLQVLLDYYNPNRGVFTAWWQRRKSGGRTEMLVQVSTEYLEVIRQGQLLEQQVRTGEKEIIEHRMFVVNNALALTSIKAENILIIEAQEEGLRVDNSQLIRTEKGMSGVRVGEAQGMSNVKINEHDRITQIDLDRKIAEAENTVRIGIINKYLSEHQKIDLIQGLIDNCYKQIDKIEKENLSAAIKNRMIEDRNDTIEAFKQDMRARQTRLLQANDGQEI